MEHLLPGRAGHVGGTARDNRLFVEAVLHRYRAGIPWPYLPTRFGKWKSVHQRFGRWAKSGVWARVFAALSVGADNEYAIRPRTSTARGRKKEVQATRPSGAVAAGCAPRPTRR